MKSYEDPIQRYSSSLWQRNLHLSAWGEYVLQAILSIIVCIPILITLAVIGILIYETALFFQQVPLSNFLTDTQWSPLFDKPVFGIRVIATGTLLVTSIAIIVAMPVGLLTAVYLGEFASSPIRSILKPTIEVLSGIPTVVYGYFALLVLTPFLQKFIPNLAGFNALSAGLITGVLVLPIVSSLSEDALRSVPYKLREAAYGLGFTKREAVIKIVLPAAFPGIVAAFTLATSRALGETLIAAIAAGQTPQLSLNPLDSIETMTAFIIQVSLGDVPPNSLEFHTIFTVGMVLFLITLILNTLGHWEIRRYRNRMFEVAVASPEAIHEQATKSLASPVNSAEETIPLKTDLVFYTSFQSRNLLDSFFKVITLLASLVGVLVLITLSFNLFQNGWSRLNWDFITNYGSSTPEEAGIRAALVGTFWLLILTALFATPIGVGAAVYLEEYLPDNLASQLIEINIANLAALPSIIYGMLGLRLFVYSLGFLTGARSILSAALTLSVIVLPLMIIATRTALRTVPVGLREGGYAAGMTRSQVLRHLVIPSAMSSIVTGTLLSLSRAISETAPLIALGAASFITFSPQLSLEGLRSSFTALPVLIFNWASRPQKDFQANAAAAIIVLVGILFLMNILAIILRNRYAREQS